MKKKIFLFCFLISGLSIYAQIGVKTKTVDPNAALEINSNTNKGLLLPRLALTGINNLTNLSPFTGTITAGMVVYNTATAGTAPNNVVPGYYYNDGSKWVLIGNANNGWKTGGNAGTSSTINFIGTTDGQPLSFRANNTDNARLDNAGRFSIGNPAVAKELLHVENGNILITNTADAAGVPTVTFIPTPASAGNTSANPASKINFYQANSTTIGMELGFHSPIAVSALYGTQIPPLAAPPNGIFMASRLNSITPSLRFYFSQNSAAYKSTGAGNFAAFSDSRTKKNVKPFNGALATILAINPVYYQYNGSYGTDNDGKDKVGVIAQDMEKIAPYTIVDKLGKDKILTYDGSSLTYVLINAIKEQQKQLIEKRKLMTLIANRIDELMKNQVQISR
jgi:hypothetical protein